MGKHKGKRKKNYVIFNGIIGWGIPTAISVTVISSLFENHTIILNQEFFRSLLIAVIIFPICGILFGLWMWHWTERIYKKSINKK
jgi:predicted permease